jgi:hypothetical protein
MNFTKYDAPVLAMIKAFNGHVGEDVDLVTIRDEWYFNMEHKEDNKFVYWLDMTMEIVNKDVNIVYKRLPGWYTEVKFFVERVIEL